MFTRLLCIQVLKYLLSKLFTKKLKNSLLTFQVYAELNTKMHGKKKNDKKQVSLKKEKRR